MTADEHGFIETYLKKSVAAMQAFATGDALHETVLRFADVITESFRAGCKIMIAGNGGSAGDAQHMAGEFVSRLFFDHAPLPAIALTTDTSVITATGNDYGYEHVFERQILGLGRKGDVFLGISTSGNSPNILAGFAAAKRREMICLGFAGEKGGKMAPMCDDILYAPSPETAVIQQIHITAVHLICGLVEKRIFTPAA